MKIENKKGLQNEDPHKNNYILSNYFVSLSWWIANLGVVPLLLFSAFLFWPIFFLRLALFVFVILVFETILKLLNIYKSILKLVCSRRFLPPALQTVKVFVLLCPISSIYSAINIENNTIFLAKGSHQEVKVTNMTRYSIGNKEIIGHKHVLDSKKIILKGSRIGHTELAIWGKNKEGKRVKIIKKYQVYVFSKKKHLKTVHILEAAKEYDLRGEIKGDLIFIDGVIKNTKTYNLIASLKNKYKDEIYLDIKLAPKFRNELIGKVYEEFFKKSLFEIKCTSSTFPLNCDIPNLSSEFKGFLERIEKKYHIEFTKVPSNKKLKSYKVSLKIFLMEKVNGEGISLGLNQLSSNVEDLFTTGISALIRKNHIFLKNNNIELSMLAEPTSIVQLGHKMEVQVGQELPFHKSEESLEWKFAGLKVSIKIDSFLDKIKVHYKSELTTPGEKNSNISGNKESSTMLIGLGSPTTIFEIGLKSKKSHISRTPFISAIPLLGNIFKSKETADSFKKITGVLLIESN